MRLDWSSRFAVSRCLEILDNRIDATETLFVVWVTIVNVINAAGLGDLALTLVTLISFALGSLGGLLMSLRLAGLTALSILGGMSVGMRLVLIREGLLFSSKLGLNWIVVVVCAVAGFAVTLLRQRIGTVRAIVVWDTPRGRRLTGTFAGSFLHVHRNVPPLAWD